MTILCGTCIATSRFCSTSNQAPAYVGIPLSLVQHTIDSGEFYAGQSNIRPAFNRPWHLLAQISNTFWINEDSEAMAGGSFTCAVCAAALIDGQKSRLWRQHCKQVDELQDEVRQHLLIVVHVGCHEIPLCRECHKHSETHHQTSIVWPSKEPSRQSRRGPQKIELNSRVMP